MPSVSCNARFCSCNLICRSALYERVDVPEEVSMVGLSGTLKSPPSIGPYPLEMRTGGPIFC